MMGELHTSYMGIGIVISVDTDTNKLVVVSTVRRAGCGKMRSFAGRLYNCGRRSKI